MGDGSGRVGLGGMGVDELRFGGLGARLRNGRWGFRKSTFGRFGLRYAGVSGPVLGVVRRLRE